MRLWARDLEDLDTAVEEIVFEFLKHRLELKMTNAQVLDPETHDIVGYKKEVQLYLTTKNGNKILITEAQA